MKLPRQPGTKEARYAHLLGGSPDLPEGAPAAVLPGPGRLDLLAAEVRRLREELAELREAFNALRRQLE